MYDSGSSPHVATGKVFFLTASNDVQFLNPDKNVIRMRSHKFKIKCFISLPPKYSKFLISNF